MRGTHKDRESFKFRNRKKNTKGKAARKQLQHGNALYALWSQQQQSESGEVETEQHLIEDSDESDESNDDGDSMGNFVEIDELPIDPDAEKVASLYAKSRLTRSQAIQLLHLYRTRHKLTDAAFADLLDMLHSAFLPANNTLPRTLYSFSKALDEDCVLQVVRSSSNFVVFDVASQINGVVAQNFSSFTEHRQTMRNAQFFDYCGSHLRDHIDDYISISIFTDGAPIAKSRNQQIWPLLGFVLDLPPKLQKSIENVIWIGICICERNPDWSNFFEEISPQFLHLNANPMTLRLDSLTVRTNGVVAPQYKVRIMELLADNIGRADILMMKKPPGFSCCPLCKITGEWNAQAKTVLYTDKAARLKKRDSWFVGQANGIRAISPLADILGVHHIPNVIQVDCMHTLYAGIFKHMLHAMYGKKKNITEPFFDSAYQNTTIHRPREIKRRVRPFKLLKRFKANEFKTIMHFVLVTFLPEFADLNLGSRAGYRMAINCLLLCCGVHTLAKKNLTRDDVKFAQQLFNHWHSTLGKAFGNNFYTFKAHQVLHLAALTLKHGSCVHRTCFAGESVVGFALARISSPKDALWQVSERIKRMPAKALDISTKEWFTTTEYIACNKFNVHFGDFTRFNRSSQQNATEIREFFRTHFPNKRIMMCRRFRLDHCIIAGRALNGIFNDAIVYMKSYEDGSLRPAIVELFFEVDDVRRALVRPLYPECTLASTFRWIERDQQAYNLLTSRRAFSGCFLLKPDPGALHNIGLDRIFSKGIIVQTEDKNYVFPNFAFDHD